MACVSLAGLVLTAACARDSEAGLRERLEQWFAVGDTVTFEARGDCLAAVFRLNSADVKAQGLALSQEGVGVAMAAVGMEVGTE